MDLINGYLDFTSTWLRSTYIGRKFIQLYLEIMFRLYYNVNETSKYTNWCNINKLTNETMEKDGVYEPE
jgi:hypothetical protein